MSQKYSNYASSTLLNAIDTGADSLQVQPGDGELFPDIANTGDFFIAVLQKVTGEIEIVKVSVRNGDQFLSIERAQEGTTALDWSVGARVELRDTAGGMARFIQRGDDSFDGNETKYQIADVDTITGDLHRELGVKANTATDDNYLTITTEGGQVQPIATSLVVSSTTPSPSQEQKGRSWLKDEGSGNYNHRIWNGSAWTVCGYSVLGGDILGPAKIIYGGVTYLETGDNLFEGNPAGVKGIKARNLRVIEDFYVQKNAQIDGTLKVEGIITSEVELIAKGQFQLGEATDAWRDKEGALFAWVDSTAQSGGRVYTGYSDTTPPDIEDLNIGDMYFEFEGTSP